MTSINTGLKRSLTSAFVLIAVLSCSGCTSPSSAAPLLRVTERALSEESQRLSQDAERDRDYVRQSLDMLEDAYVRDLERAEDLNAKWVREATLVYVAAREALIRHEQALARERDDRAENLRTAGAAVRRALSLIEQQDHILRGVVGDELHNLLSLPDFTSQEPSQ